ncbi:GGDEF domain-containing protein [Desulfurobacterium atlanticum]|uniref:diguanylate cyclase n=1 Tax=Desulfurobacterium atlanticum TaxID=240169 RepID=A0A238Y4R2_9BACT|nr:GGDEF domain-containing protein [Desulfurobacterium atlanticum]SNR65564.1 diguanylate cyclase (GGDEF) domain-containing protein [Desulfurobacterium atlanticum]
MCHNLAKKIDKKDSYYLLIPYRICFLRNIEIVTLFCFIFVGFIPAHYFEKQIIEQGIAAAIFLTIFSIFLYRLEKYYFSAIVFISSIVMVCFSILLQREHSLYMWFITVPMLSILLLPFKDAVMFITLFIFGFLYTGIYIHNHDIRAFAYYFINLTAFIVVSSVGAFVLKRIVEENFIQLIELSIKDPLTGAYNRYAFLDFINEEMERAKRYGFSISIIMFDIDDFKKINDTHGHLKGDEVLKEIARLVRENIRKCDKLVRWGGEEFIILCPHIGVEEAEKLAEKLRRLIENNDFGIKVTVSFGVAEVDFEKGIDDAINKADEALYHSKRSGKNKVSVFSLSC